MNTTKIKQKISRLNQNLNRQNTKALVFYPESLEISNNADNLYLIPYPDIDKAYYIKLTQPQSEASSEENNNTIIFNKKKYPFDFPFSVNANKRNDLQEGFPGIGQNLKFELNLNDTLLKLEYAGIDIIIKKNTENKITIQINYESKPVTIFEINNSSITGVTIGKTTKNFQNSTNISSLLSGKISVMPTHYNIKKKTDKLREYPIIKNITCDTMDYLKLSEDAFKDLRKEDEYAYILKQEEIEVPMEIYNGDVPIYIGQGDFYWSNSINKIQWGNLEITKLQEHDTTDDNKK